MIRKLNIPAPYVQQQLFYKAKTKYIAYGGARGGGKSHAARTKAVLLALHYPGIQILLLRRTLPELRENHTIPLQMMLDGIAAYRERTKEFLFPSGSRILLGYCRAERDVLQYQGQAYDVIFMEEATQFTEFQFQALTESNRSSGMCRKAFSPRMYFTCNPGGVGHGWVKRLFIEKRYEKREQAEDYTFIPAKVYDNFWLMEHDPDYVRTLENLPEGRRKAMLEGNWDLFDGQYFDEFSREIHVVKPFELPQSWKRYRTLDYGLDMLACYWIAVNAQGRAYIYKELYQSGLIVSDAARLICDYTNESIYMTLAPPDLWNKHSDTGRSTAEIFGDNAVLLSRADNSRIQGWYDLKEWLKPYEDEQGRLTANLLIFDNCVNLMRTLPALQYDPRNPNDTAGEPHELTHAPDAIRYFVAGRPQPYRSLNPAAHCNFACEKPKVRADGYGDRILRI